MLPGTVMVAYLHPNQVGHNFFHSMAQVLTRDVRSLDRIEGMVGVRCGAGGLVEGRNRVFQGFLEDSTAEWLWMVDTDMGFRSDALDVLVASADPETRPVMGALCYAVLQEGDDGMGGAASTTALPTLAYWAGGGKVRWRMDIPDDQIAEVDATGAACMVMHRNAAMRLHEEFGYSVFNPVKIEEDGDALGEDFSFCVRLGAVGIPIHVNTGVKTSHYKSLWVSSGNVGG